ncbi:MAG: potassium channel family protein [Alkalispirochaetaceae bacterium]
MLRKLANTLQNWLRHSQYSKPVIYFALFFALASVSIYLFELGRNQQFIDVMDGLWWAIITFSTTGYGDKVPVTTGGRLVAVLTILIGVGGMSLLSGTLASLLVDRNTKARRGLMDFRKVKGHLIICGWKEDMKEILLSILRASSEYESEGVVIVSNVEPERVEELKEDENLRGLKFVRGDYFSELALRRANVSQARKVLILADTLESSAVSEVDSKTVMTVLTCKALAKDVYVTAEVLDKKYESYLKHAQCDEILFSRDFSRQMLASTSVTNGMSHIIYDLLTSDESGSKLLTEPIPQRFVNGSYGEFRASFGETSSRLLLGVLENTGSPNRMKMEALRDAQKTSDVSQLVSNLQKVKGLEVNNPIFLPEDDHTVQRHSLAIVLERGGNG